MEKQQYHFDVERPEGCAVWFAYIWRAGEDATTAPPVKTFHSMREGAEQIVSAEARQWINDHGALEVHPWTPSVFQ